MKTFSAGWAGPVVRTTTWLALSLAATIVRAADPVPGAASSGAGAGAKRPTLADLFGDDVIVRGKGVEVRRSQLENAFVAYRSNLEARGQRIPEEQRNIRETQLLDRLIVTQLLLQRATDEDRRLAKGFSERFLTDSKKGMVSEESFARHLKAMGMTPEQFQKRVDEQSIAEAVISREIKEPITISDEEVREFYEKGTDLDVRLAQADLEKLVKDPNSTAADVARLKERIDTVRKENLQRLEQPERVRIQHVFFAGRDVQSERELSPEQLKLKRERAEKIRARALAGEDFARLVQDNSEDRGLKETKGEYTFGRGDRFSEEFKSAAFTLQPGRISDVVSTPYGFHVIKLLERIPARKIEMDKASKDLKDFLRQQRMQQAMPPYFARLRKEANVEVLDAKYRIEVPGNIDPTRPE
jgi:parvulin-like peptidyl-prolyl isomerase